MDRLIGKRRERGGGDFPSVGRTRVWGSGPPDPPFRSGTPPLKLALQMDGLWVAWCGIHFTLDSSWELLD